ncbi:16S rRNA processing protein RimM [Candidatus Sulfurimonas marisnigri]|uniref:Ribosome maturation factor RimM n=1 Tax=Candidatus Sulfurimonas marisnigri TaxID=2740405 RepID=A0A7S7M209_9BACT|nr:ribosome maturation factor RimM [Candidatus Sulfurimonas marisnigri]QOY55053.1 16S rRNA processing protein RimM [Candidatus Sulfurimonas marisnigri]
MSKQFKEQLLHIATIGKTVGIHGDMKLHINTDFPEQFQNGATFFTNKKIDITLSDLNLERGTTKIAGINSIEDAKKYTNAKLFTTREDTRKNCHLEDGEYFWFDLEDCEVYEDGKILGTVNEVERITISNYLNVKTDDSLVKTGSAKSFLIPFQEPFKVSVDIDKKIITVTGAMDILEAS